MHGITSKKTVGKQQKPQLILRLLVTYLTIRLKPD